MKYYSTNGKSGPVTFREALFTGLAADGGLFMPEAFPSRGQRQRPATGQCHGPGNKFFRDIESRNFHELAFAV